MKPEIEAEIYYLTEEEGGRKTPIYSDYRGQFFYNGQDWDAPQEFIDKEICSPGETVKVYLKTLSPNFHAGKLKVGQEFETREGSRTVGKGKITKILRPEFEYWDEQTLLKSLPPNIKPYSGKNFKKICQDIKSQLIKLGLFEKVQLEINNRPECLILITCRQKANNSNPRILADTITDYFKNALVKENSKYKIQLAMKHDLENMTSYLDKFVLSFATWESMYLSGQIIVTQ